MIVFLNSSINNNISGKMDNLKESANKRLFQAIKGK